jgi:hypothetical protein
MQAKHPTFTQPSPREVEPSGIHRCFVTPSRTEPSPPAMPDLMRVLSDGTYLFSVPSDSDPGTLRTVRRHPDEQVSECTCPGWCRWKHCRHVDSVLFWFEMFCDIDPEEEEVEEIDAASIEEALSFHWAYEDGMPRAAGPVVRRLEVTA